MKLCLAFSKCFDAIAQCARHHVEARGEFADFVIADHGQLHAEIACRYTLARACKLTQVTREPITNERDQQRRYGERQTACYNCFADQLLAGTLNESGGDTQAQTAER